MQSEDRVQHQQSIQTIQLEDNCRKWCFKEILAFAAAAIVGLSFAFLLSSPDTSSSSNLQPLLKPSPANFSQQIESLALDINRIRSSFSQFQCVPITPILPAFDQSRKVWSNSKYYQTFDGFMMQGCINSVNMGWSVTLQKIIQWNNNRQISEWAYQYIHDGATIAYYRETFNALEIVLLSKIIGASGYIQIIADKGSEICIQRTRQLYQMNKNYKFGMSFQKTYNVVIANDTIFNNTEILSKISEKSILLLYSKKPEMLRSFFPTHRIQKFSLEKKECGRGIYEEELSGQGFYSLTLNTTQKKRTVINKQFPIKQQSLATLEFDSMNNKFEKKNQLIKKKLSLKEYDFREMCFQVGNRTDEVYSIYGQQLWGVSIAEVEQWEGERGAVEWVREKAKGTTYYEMRHSFNLLAVVEIAHLLANNSLLLFCADECPLIEQQLSRSALSNVQLIRQSSPALALSSAIVISDNEQLLQACLADNFTQRGAMLGHFTVQRAESLTAMRQIFVRHQLREVITPQPIKQCIGFEYSHYYWRSNSPHGFYQISPSNHVLYVFQNSLPEQISSRKMVYLKEMFKSSVQIKIIRNNDFPFFEVKDSPFHQNYNLLQTQHRRDYFLAYLMHHYGGIFAKINSYPFDWAAYLERLENDPARLASGYYQLQDSRVSCFDTDTFPSCKQIRRVKTQLLGWKYFIFKRDSAMTREWLESLSHIIDKKVKNYNDHGNLPENSHSSSKNVYYIRRQNELGSEVLAKIAYKYRKFIYTDMPYVQDDLQL